MRHGLRKPGLVAGVAMLAMGCNDGAPSDPGVQAFVDLPADQVIDSMRFNATREGIRVYHLLSDTAYLYQDSSVMNLVGVDLEMYEDNGGLRATLVSERGTYNSNTDAMIARGNVILRIVADGQVIRTQELNYDPRSHRIWSDSVTQRTLNGETLEFDRFTADDEFRNIRLIGPRGRIGGGSSP